MQPNSLVNTDSGYVMKVTSVYNAFQSKYNHFFTIMKADFFADIALMKDKAVGPTAVDQEWSIRKGMDRIIIYERT